jgi:hypothetical protein
MPQNSIKKAIFGLFFTISPTRTGLMSWLGAYFQAKMLGLTSCPLEGFHVLFWVHLGRLKYPRQHEENYHLVVLDHFSWNNGQNDLVRGLFLGLYFGPYILPTCGPLCAFLGPFFASFGLSLLQDWAYLFD